MQLGNESKTLTEEKNHRDMLYTFPVFTTELRRDIRKSMGRVVWQMFFFRFVSQEGLIASKVILFPCTKLIVRISYLFAIFFEKFTKMKPADDITERCQWYKMNEIKCFSSNSSHFNWITLKITQCYNSPLQVLILSHIFRCRVSCNTVL